MSVWRGCGGNGRFPHGSEPQASDAHSANSPVRSARAASRHIASASGTSSRYDGPAQLTFASAASSSPSATAAAKARHGAKRTTTAAASPFTPYSTAVSTSNAPDGAATTAASPATTPARPNASVTNRVTGSPTKRAPSTSDEIASSALPKRVRASVQAV